MSQYYYLDGSTPVGPFSLQDVYTLIDREVVGPATMLCREGGADWQLLPLIPELSGKSHAAALTRAPSSEEKPSRRSSSAESRAQRKRGFDVMVIIVAVLFAIVAIYITHTITRAYRESVLVEQGGAPSEP